MLDLLDIKYRHLSDLESNELFTLRKRVFKDRLNWMVNCQNDMEFDEYDNEHTTYVFGVHNDICVCSLRFIETKYPNMITGTFRSWFKNTDLPEGNYVEASRLFIDKERISSLKLRQKPVSALLFLSMINYARHYQYEGIYAIVSHPMYLIFKKSGWKIEVVEKSLSEKNENIYLIFMPIDDKNQRILIELVKSKAPELKIRLDAWPLSFPVGQHGPDQL
ncbi:acyl-homoserine-lactone synthase [Erwinia sp. BNK-24-b]|uniref:acyl-homoserine-lactone synthase n=1 Tax=Erwinia TaxID=551 RepID=UPI001FEDF5A9|nr:acyl-homoserine-lactone synthase [Erwinia phyllosphaerae]MBV4366112.1 acyl-homoserine-lactone synthase [Erwinia phyllosphaerae]